MNLKTLDRTAFRRLLASPVDGASLAMFRISFGLILAAEAVWFLWPLGDTNRARISFSTANWHFPFPGFEWVRPLPEPLLQLHLVVIALAGVAVALGLWYRAASIVLFVAFGYLFLIDVAWYLNHFYLMCLLSFLLIFLPAERCFSIDARRRGGGAAAIAFWPIFLLRAQVAILYVYAGIAKIDSDWLSGAPLETAEFGRRLSGLIGAAAHDVAVFLAWSGLLFDLGVVLLLLPRRTRWLGVLLAFLFHGTNQVFLPIGVFPSLAFCSTLIFCEPDWPRRLWARIRRRSIVPLAPRGVPPMRPFVPALLGLWLALHCVVPLRHLAIPGDSTWTEEGYWFSWRMMLRMAEPRFLRFEVGDSRILAGDPADGERVDWRAWPADSPKIPFVKIDARQTDWTLVPRVVATYEPVTGLRLVDNPLATDDSERSIDAREARLRRMWSERFGHEPRVLVTASVTEILQSAGTDLARRPRTDPAIPAQLARIADALRLHTASGGTERGRMELIDRLDEIVRTPYGDVVATHLRRAEPFAIQGARETGAAFLVVDDPAIGPTTSWNELERLFPPGSIDVRLDLARLRPAAWQRLPAAMLLREAQRTSIVWNHHSELNSEQVQRLGRSSWMVHRYARRIAERWEAETGSRPEVRAICYVSMNNRPPSLLVDPDVDLARAPMRYLRHNPWILAEGRQR